MTKDFYADVVSSSGIDKEAMILIVCAGPYDRQTFLDCGYKNVTISNLEPHDRTESNYEPYKWTRQDAEFLNLPDATFDWVVVNAGLHHCSSPHRAVCEMLRVCRKGILVLEARDSFLMKLAVRLGLTVDYELEPTALSGASAATSFGGLRNTFIPNYIYRWTERDVEKTVFSYLPQYKHTFRYFYGLRLPTQRIAMSKNPMVRWSVKLLTMFGWIFTSCLPKQTNNFAFIATKQNDVQPWMVNTDSGLEINRKYFDARFDPEKYQKI